MELVLDAEGAAIGADPYVMIRPEGNGTSLGFSSAQGSSGEPPHRPGRTMGFLVAFIRWTGQSSLFNTATRFSRWIEGFEPWRSDMVFERGKPSCYASAPFCEVMECGGGNFVLAGFAAKLRASQFGRRLKPGSSVHVPADPRRATASMKSVQPMFIRS